MNNIDRFIQDLDNIQEPSFDISNYSNLIEKIDFLDIGEIVDLNNNQIKEVSITDRLVKHNNRLYDYEGTYTDASGENKIVYFNDDNIDEIKHNKIR